MRRVYVAGAYSADDVISVLDNIRRGIRLSTMALQSGFAPFCPHLDHHFFLGLHDDEFIPLETIRQYSITWLRVCDAVLLIPGWEESDGTAAELVEAGRLGLPVFTSLEDLVNYRNWD